MSKKSKSYKKKCLICGKEYESKASWQKYCSKECKLKAQKKRYKKYQKREKKFPKYIMPDGKIIQLSFDPIREKQRYENFIQKNHIRIGY